MTSRIASVVSSPMRPMRRERPHGVPQAEVDRHVDVLDDGDALVQS